MESLERRELLSITIDGNLITVTGSRRSDQITVSIRCRLDSDMGVTHDVVKIVINGKKEAVTQELDAQTAITVWGGAGDDRIKSKLCTPALTLRGGGPGDDRIRVETSWATVRGGAGDDLIRMIGSPVADQYGNLSGGAGDDTIVGGPGSDTLSGAAGNDLLLGEGGNDRLAGGIGKDRFFGGEGDDVLNVSKGGLARGGGGRDEFRR